MPLILELMESYIIEDEDLRVSRDMRVRVEAEEWLRRCRLIACLYWQLF